MQNLNRQLLGYKVICWFSYSRPYFNLKLWDNLPFSLNFSAALFVFLRDPPISIVPCLFENQEECHNQSLLRWVLVQTPFLKVTQDLETPPCPPQAVRPYWEWYFLASGNEFSLQMGLPSTFNISTDVVAERPETWPPVTIMAENIDIWILIQYFLSYFLR